MSPVAAGPLVWILILLIGIVALIAAAIASRKSKSTGGFAVGVVIVLGLLFVGLYVVRRSVPSSRPQPSPRTVSSPQATPPGAPRIEAPDDLAAWKRAGTLGFTTAQGRQDWIEDAERHCQRELCIVGDTEFVLWMPAVRDREAPLLAGFSEEEATSELARDAAHERVQAKIAVLALRELKSRQPQLVVAALEPLARSLARQSRYFHPRDLVIQTRRLTDGTVVHRSAVRARVEPEDVKVLAAEVEHRVQQGWIDDEAQARRWFWTAVWAAALAFAFFLVYTFVNAGTKGYFAWPLRIVSLLLFFLVAASIYYMRTKLGSP
jgi:hypothetical protein